MRHSSCFGSRLLARTHFAILTTSIFVLIAGTATAQFDWIDPLGGNYHLTNNWSTANVPNTAAESARFNLPNTYNVSFFSGDNVTINDLIVSDGDVTFVAPGAATYNADDVVLNGGDLTLFESFASGRVDLNALTLNVSESSTLTFDGGSQSTTGRLFVGHFANNSTGNVRVLNGSTLDVTNAVDFQLGLQTNGVSTMLVDGTGSMLTTGPGVNFNIGSNGAATLDVTGGATVFADRNNVNVGVGVFGSRLTIDGGSTFTTFDAISGDYGVTSIGQSTFFPATVEVFGGSVFESGRLRVRGGSDVTVDDPGSRLSVNFPLGVQDTSTVVVQGGATLELLGTGGSAITERGSLVVTGAGTTLLGNDGITMQGDSTANPVSVQILDGAVAMPAFPGGLVEFYIDSNAELIVDGAGSLYDSPISTLTVGTNGIGTVTISNGGTINQFRLQTGGSSSSNATIDLDGGTLNISDQSTLGGTTGGTATVNLLPGSLFNVGGDVVLNPGGTINLFGGELRLSELNKLRANGGTVNWNNGTVRINGNTTLTPTASTLLMPSGTLGFGQELRIDGNLTLQSTVVVDGGTLSLLGLVNTHLLQLKSGRFEFLDDNLIIGIGGPLGEEFELRDGMTLFSDNDIIVDGVLIAGGRVDSFLSTSTTGEIRVELGERLTVAAPLFNSGSLQLQGGRVDVGTNLTNAATGNIMGRGTLAVGTVLTNQGDLALSNGQTDIFGDVNNTAGGRVIVSGNADVTFWGDVTDTGSLFNVSTGSSATFFGTAGFGISGGGDVYFEADVTPGSSPGLETFGGDVHFGVLATLEVEIGGTTPGSEFDVLDIAALADLGGALEVTLLGGFSPAIGDTFEIITAANVVDTFDMENFPDLGGLLWDISYGATNVVLEVVSPFAADFDNDGDVDADDLTKWQGDFAANGSSDADADGDSDGADFLAWQQQLGSGVPSFAASQTVPEPSALWLLLAGFVQWTCVRKTCGHNLRRARWGQRLHTDSYVRSTSHHKEDMEVHINEAWNSRSW